MTDAEVPRQPTTFALWREVDDTRIRTRVGGLFYLLAWLLTWIFSASPAGVVVSGVLGSCLTHITLIQAAERGLKIDSIEVEVTGDQHPLAQQPGFEHVPVFPHNLRYTLDIVSPEPPETIRALHQAVEAVCPIFNLLTLPQTIDGELRHTHG